VPEHVAPPDFELQEPDALVDEENVPRINMVSERLPLM
jgi:hypothetical protein